ncbi:hypothetical protein ACN47E_008595 [Coniothyrium glycines]
MASSHSRNVSEESTSTSMAYILEHLLQYPGSYDFPLKTMFELNRTDRALPKDFARGISTANRSGNSSPVSGHFAWNASETAAMTFQASLMNQLKSLPTRNSSLPPAFINNFVLKVLQPELKKCDWIQALTALDYLKDLETRRRKETLAAFERLHIHQDTWDTDMAYMAEKFPGIALWINNIEGKNKKAQQYYGSIWLGVRRWILINELSDDRFNKLNCLSMLNTLLPPVHEKTKLPSSFLSLQLLREERQIFFELINRVQKHGSDVVQPLIEKDKGPQDVTAWPTIYTVLEKYLRVAIHMIEDCQATTGPESFDRYTDGYGREKKHDSGVSFGSDRRPSVASSVQDKHVVDSSSTYAPSQKGLSKLERITREFKRMRVKPRPEIDEIVQVTPRAAVKDTSPRPMKKSLKKARSLASLKFGNSSSLSLASRRDSDAVPFDAGQMKKQRQIYETSLSKTNT